MSKREKTSDSSESTTKIILDSISDGVFTIDHNWEITSFNKAAEKITGIPRDKAIGRHCWDVFKSNMCEKDCALKRTMEEEESFLSTSTYIINSKQKSIPIAVSTSPLKNEQGEILGGVETFRDQSIVEELRKELKAVSTIGDMISNSPAMQKIFEIIPLVANSDSTVLIQGDTGTGKEVLSKVIHNSSKRKDKPFIAINCGALPDSLLESELFGYKKGAFTNAIRDKDGYFALADGGTILLDEIGDISPAFQSRLLRVLQDHEFYPLGAENSKKTDIRIIAATNKNLPELVAKEQFRQDLFYRINVVNIKLPSLSERMEDIPFLIEHFISKMNIIRNKSIKGISKESLSYLMSHNYKGNIRELENIIEHAFVLCSDDIIQPKHLPSGLIPDYSPIEISGSINNAVNSAEKAAILEALKRNNYNRTKAAHDLGMHKSTLFRKLKKLNIKLSY